MKRSVLTAPELSVTVASPRGHGERVLLVASRVFSNRENTGVGCIPVSDWTCVFVSISNLKLTTDNTRHPQTLEPHLSEDILHSDSLSSDDLPFKLPQVSQTVLHFLKPGSKHRTLHVLFRLSFLKSKTVPSSSFSERCVKGQPSHLTGGPWAQVGLLSAEPRPPRHPAGTDAQCGRAAFLVSLCIHFSPTAFVLFQLHLLGSFQFSSMSL